MRKRLVNKLNKRFAFATYNVGDGIVNVNGIALPNKKGFMKKHSSWEVNEWYDERPTKRDLKDFLKKRIR